MKASLATVFSVFAILALAALFIPGCATAKPIDWNSRVGHYTFDLAVTDFGPPDKQTVLSDGRLVAQWVWPSSGGGNFSVGTGFFSGPVGLGISENVGSGYPNRMLTLTFGTNYVLTAWSKRR